MRLLQVFEGIKIGVSPLKGDNMKKRFSIYTLSISLIILLISSAANAAEPIRIGTSLSLTGKYAWTGNRMLEGYQVWEALINEKGFSPGLEKYGSKGPGLINGRPVKLIVYDDKSDPATGVKLYQKLITDDKVDLLMGPYSSAIAKAVTPVVERAKMPMVSSGGSDDSIWKGEKLQWHAQGLVPTSKYTPGLAAIAEAKGCKTAALIFEDTAFPIALAEAAKEELEKKGIKIILYEAYPKGLSDWTPVLRKAWALKPDIIGIGAYEPDAIGLTKAAQAIKASPKILYWTVGAYSKHYAESVGDAGLGIITDVLWDQSANTPGNRDYVKEFERIIGTPIPEQAQHSAMGFSGLQVLEACVKMAGSLDPTAIRDKMFSQEIPTIRGTYKVEPLTSPNSGFQVLQIGFLLQWQKKNPGSPPNPYRLEVNNLAREIIWPFEAKSAEVLFPFPNWDNR